MSVPVEKRRYAVDQISGGTPEKEIEDAIGIKYPGKYNLTGQLGGVLGKTLGITPDSSIGKAVGGAADFAQKIMPQQAPQEPVAPAPEKGFAERFGEQVIEAPGKMLGIAKEAGQDILSKGTKAGLGFAAPIVDPISKAITGKTIQERLSEDPAAQAVYGDKNVQNLVPKDALDWAGASAETITTLLAGKAGQQLLKVAPEGFQLLKKLAIDGAKFGGLYGASQGAQVTQSPEGQDLNAAQRIGEVAGGAVKGAATGVVLSPLGGLASKYMGYLSGAPKQQIAPADSKVVTKRIADLKKIEGSKANLRTYVAKQSERKFSPADDIAKTDLLKDAVDNTGTIRTKQEGGALEQYNAFIKPQEKVVSQALATEGKTVPLADVEKALVDAVNKSGLKGASRTAALNQVKKEIAGYRSELKGATEIPVSLIHEAKVDKYANVNYLNEGGRVDKTIAKILKELVEKNTESVDVKALNDELARHYANIGYLEKLDGAKVEGGKLGKHFATLLGGLVGSSFGPLGTIAGAELAGGLKGKLMSSTFNKPTGGTLQSSEAMQKALQSNSERALNKSQATTTAPIKNPIDSSIPQGPFNKAATPQTIDSTPSEFRNLVARAQTSDKSLTHYSPEELKTLKTKLLPNKQAGYAYKVKGDTMELSNVFTLPEARGQGLGKTVMESVINEARQKGLKSVKLDAYKYLERFYNKFGFETTRELPYDPKYAAGFDPRVKGQEAAHNIIYMELKL